ncbi:UvrD-helicase domain-containing protein [Silvibacterium acidisoli]|uniref:UvrD-helicase domain-containing protein n=1 Tax=Acidobacteriaceae bacterium ZG23-2 TaxID=2883246 RepID=UPI00406BE806
MPEPIRDLKQREEALDPSRNFIVRAPAGSGKTALLTSRFLRLLAIVDEPEEILAITFTRAATAEMRARILKQLEAAARTEPSIDEGQTITLARAALAHSAERGWRLLEQPHRLNVETIDSLCLRIAHGQPLLSRMGGRLTPTEHAAPLYALAARRTLAMLGSNTPAAESVSHMLAMRDNNLADCERLVTGMLARRDQWGSLLTAELNDDLRHELEQPFRDEVKKVCSIAHGYLSSQPLLANTLFELANFACDNGNDRLAGLTGIFTVPSPGSMSVEHWKCVAHFLLTSEGEWRKPGGINKNHGFPAEQKTKKQAMGKLLEELGRIDGLREVLCSFESLPLPGYTEEQWETIRHFFATLRYAIAHLRVLFAERNEVDFVEVGLAARQVLKDADPDALLLISGNIRHLLVDEFQDTSRSQHDLIRQLIRAWDAGDARTGFLVGDPMQSIYMFRQAEVELFTEVEQNGIGSEDFLLECEQLRLTTNFRSHSGLTDHWNSIFETIFSRNVNAASVAFEASYAAEEALPIEAVQVYPQVLGSAENAAAEQEKNDAREGEAQQVASIIEDHLPVIAQALASGSEYRVAVLVRARQHLAKIIRLLRQRGIPFRAVEIETLTERQELQDLLSLTRALLHPMDRVAWLAVLRAPWCGLPLHALHALSGGDNRAARRRPMLELIEQNISLLDDDSATRAQRTVKVLKQALATRFHGPHASSFSTWIERTWRTLGGPECLDTIAHENVQVFFSMLDEVAPDGMAALTEDFAAAFNTLYAHPDPSVSERAGVQLMTIHKSKGLGFEVVIVPGLDRKPAMDGSPLLTSLERCAPGGRSEMLLAPISTRGSSTHPTYQWIQKQRQQRLDEESKRLLYVACTRARRELHLLGAAVAGKEGIRAEHSRSLLAIAWPAFEDRFVAAFEGRSEDEAESNLLPFPEPSAAESIELAATVESGKLTLHRLPAPATVEAEPQQATTAVTEIAGPAFKRPEGSRRARAVGNAVHAIFDQLANGARSLPVPAQARNLLRRSALSGRALEEAVKEVVDAVTLCSADTTGQWILAAHKDAQSEISWTGWLENGLKTLRADRLFRAGAEPGQAGEDHLWIIDYKMSTPAGEALEDFLLRQRQYYSPQLRGYAGILRQIEGPSAPIRLGLYYPRIAKFDWWQYD